jgi:hypothetical protein
METVEPRCPVCGYEPLFAPSWEGGEPSDEICPCCGTHFGYDDFADSEEGRRARHQELRARWIASGHPWFSTSRRPPKDWDPTVQVGRAEGR